MDGIASPLRRKKRDEEIDRLHLARVFVIALEILARSEDFKFLVADRDVGSRPIANLGGQGAHMLIIPAPMEQQEDRCSQHRYSHNPQSKRPMLTRIPVAGCSC